MSGRNWPIPGSSQRLMSVPLSNSGQVRHYPALPQGSRWLGTREVSSVFCAAGERSRATSSPAPLYSQSSPGFLLRLCIPVDLLYDLELCRINWDPSLLFIHLANAIPHGGWGRKKEVTVVTLNISLDLLALVQRNRNKACHDSVYVGVYGMRVCDIYECVCMCPWGGHLCPCMWRQKRGTEGPTSHSSRLTEAEVAGFWLGWLANNPSDAAFSAHPRSQPEVKGAQSQARLLDECHGV